MAAKLNYAGMAKELVASLDEKKQAAFLREQSLAGDHSFLLASIERSNLRPSLRKVVEELITGKLRRPKQRPRSDDTDLNNARRALRVLDLEAAGWGGKRHTVEKRGAAITEAAKQLHCSYSAVEKALLKYEKLIKGTDPHLLDNLRSAFK